MEIDLMGATEDKYLVIIRNENSNPDPWVTILIDQSIPLEQVEDEVLSIKKSLPYDWQLSDILSAFTFDYIELPSESIYI